MEGEKKKKIAIIHDYLYVYGGAERNLEVFHEIFPEAPIYTSYFVKNKFPPHFATWDIRESFLGKTFLKNTWFRRFFTILAPIGIESFDLSDYDVVISISNGPAKGVITQPYTRHIAYVLSPPWFEWNIAKARLRREIFLNHLRQWDYTAAQRPDVLVGISSTIIQRIKKFYRREATILYPPVEIRKLQHALENQEQKKEDYFVMCGRLELYKGVSTVAKILDKHGYKLKIIGKGEDEKNLKGLSHNIQHLGALNDAQKAHIIAKSKGLIFWNEDDFGMTMVEALACNTPVIAFKKGGALDIVEDHKNGIFFKQQTEESFLNAIKEFEKTNFDLSYVKSSAEKFSKEKFKENVMKLLAE